MDTDQIHYPFKFNSVWLTNDDFCDMVKDTWPMMDEVADSYSLCWLGKKIFRLKYVVRNWEKGRKEAQEKELTLH